MSDTNILADASPIVRQSKADSAQTSSDNSSARTLSFFQTKRPETFKRRANFFSFFISDYLSALYKAVWEQENTRKLIKACNLNLKSILNDDITYQGGTTQDFAIFLFDIMGLRDLPKTVTLPEADIQLRAALKNGVSKEQVEAFMQTNDPRGVDRRWNQLMRVLVFIHAAGPENPGWTVQEFIERYPRPKYAASQALSADDTAAKAVNVNQFWDGKAKAAKSDVEEPTEIAVKPHQVSRARA